MTAHGARALGLADTGRIAEGLRAELCVWDVADPIELAYAVQPGRLRQRVFGGELTQTRTQTRTQTPDANPGAASRRGAP
jgi:imidazolonepropionase